MDFTTERIQALKDALGDDGDPGSLQEIEAHEANFKQAVKTFEILQHPPIAAYVKSLIANVESMSHTLMTDKELLTDDKKKPELIRLLERRDVYLEFLDLFADSVEMKDEISSTINNLQIEKGDE